MSSVNRVLKENKMSKITLQPWHAYWKNLSFSITPPWDAGEVSELEKKSTLHDCRLLPSCQKHSSSYLSIKSPTFVESKPEFPHIIYSSYLPRNPAQSLCDTSHTDTLNFAVLLHKGMHTHASINAYTKLNSIKEVGNNTHDTMREHRLQRTIVS